VRFLSTGTRFSGTVRFHNLDPVEFGALLWAMSFGRPGGPYRHQIGRAKAQGHGVLRADIEWRPPRVINRCELAGDRNALETYFDLFRQHMNQRLQRVYENTEQIVLLRRYADPAIGEANRGRLATLPLEDHGRLTYPQLKRGFDEHPHEPCEGSALDALVPPG
jgi:hypothetical protein